MSDTPKSPEHLAFEERVYENLMHVYGQAENWDDVKDAKPSKALKVALSLILNSLGFMSRARADIAKQKEGKDAHDRHEPTP